MDGIVYREHLKVGMMIKKGCTYYRLEKLEEYEEDGKNGIRLYLEGGKISESIYPSTSWRCLK